MKKFQADIREEDHRSIKSKLALKAIEQVDLQRAIVTWYLNDPTIEKIIDGWIEKYKDSDYYINTKEKKA